MFEFLAVGFEHVVPAGLDHILFVLAVAIGARGLAGLAARITAFTLAHSLTLALAVLGVVTVPADIVEPLIALSIGVVALTNLRREAAAGSVALAFAFGLVHGLGFAQFFSGIGFGGAELVKALLAFNVGVEGGQLCVAIPAWLVLRFLPETLRSRIVFAASAALAVTGFVWAGMRVFG
jgi:hypothetical protein